MRFIQRVATISGVVFIIVSLLGLVTGGMPGMKMGGASVMLLGLFPVNLLHNLVHLAFGIWGVIAGRSEKASVTYSLGSGAAYLLLGRDRPVHRQRAGDGPHRRLRCGAPSRARGGPRRLRLLGDVVRAAGPARSRLTAV